MFRHLLVVAVAAFVCITAQDTVPACVLNCLTSSLSAGGCTSVTDLTCICASTAFQTAVGTCVAAGCPDDLAAATQLLTAQCAGVSPPATTSSPSPAAQASTPSPNVQSNANSASNVNSASNINSPAPSSTNSPTNLSGTQAPSNTAAQSSTGPLTPTNSPSHVSKNKTGAIVGGAVGGVVGAAILIALVFIFMGWRRKGRQRADNDTAVYGPEVEQKSGNPSSVTAPWLIPTAPVSQRLEPPVSWTPAPTFQSIPPVYRPTSSHSVNSGSPSFAQVIQGFDGIPYSNDEIGRWANDNRDLIPPELEAKLRNANYRPSDNPDEIPVQQWQETYGVGYFDLKRLQEVYPRRSTAMDAKAKDLHGSGQGGPSWRPPT